MCSRAGAESPTADVWRRNSRRVHVTRLLLGRRARSVYALRSLRADTTIEWRARRRSARMPTTIERRRTTEDDITAEVLRRVEGTPHPRRRWSNLPPLPPPTRAC